MRTKMIYAMLTVFIAVIATAVGNVAYTNWVDERRQTDQHRAQVAAQAAAREASCELIVAFDELYRETPPTTPAGVRVAEVWARYRVQLGC